jgi:GNAT superfamily N-acetyltransferase
VALREVRPGDAEGMHAVLAACQRSWAAFLPEGWEPPPERAARWVEELVGGRGWARVAVEAPERVVGFVGWGEARDEPAGPPLPGVANLDALFVHPERWRRGVASRLLDAAVAAMRGQGYRWGRLFTPQGGPAERFYAARGWFADGRLAWHELLGFPVVGYALAL